LLPLILQLPIFYLIGSFLGYSTFIFSYVYERVGTAWRVLLALFCFLVGTCQSVFSRCQPFCVCDFLLPRRRTCYDRHRTHMDHHHHHRLSLCARIALVYAISYRGGGARPCHLRVCVCVWPATVCPRNYLPTTRLGTLLLSLSLRLLRPVPPHSEIKEK